MLSNLDFRTHLRNLETVGLLKHVTKEVDKNWEISAVMRWVYHGNSEPKRYAVMFDQVKGYDIPVVVGAIGASYMTYAVSLDLDPMQPKPDLMNEIRKRWIKAINDPIEPVL